MVELLTVEATVENIVAITTPLLQEALGVEERNTMVMVQVVLQDRGMTEGMRLIMAAVAVAVQAAQQVTENVGEIVITVKMEALV